METRFRNVSKLSVCRLLYIIWNLKFSESMPFIVLVIYFISFPYGEFPQLYSLFKTILFNGLWFVSINILPHFWAKYFVYFNDSTLTKVSHSNGAYLFSAGFRNSKPVNYLLGGTTTRKISDCSFSAVRGILFSV